MTRAEMFARISATVVAGLVLYVASFGPAEGYTHRMRELGLYGETETTFRDEVLLKVYAPLYWLGEVSTPMENLFAKYVYWWEDMMQPKPSP